MKSLKPHLIVVGTVLAVAFVMTILAKNATASKFTSLFGWPYTPPAAS